MSYGMPYMGSKDGIAEHICKIFPPANNFYDLFGGGGAITNCMMVKRSKDFKKFHLNDIRPGVTKLFFNAAKGDYSYSVFKPKWISREEFFEKKETDAYIKLCWSFGSNGSSYLFGKEIEPQKKSLHNAVVFNQFDDTAKKLLGMNAFREGLSIKEKRLFVGSRPGSFQLERLQKLEQLGRLERLERLEQLERLERLSIYETSYELVPINPNSVIYCDIPYENTSGYDGNRKFNRKKFLDWAAENENPVFISEYQIDDKRLLPVRAVEKSVTLSSTKNNNKKIEMVFANRAAMTELRKFK